MKYILDIDGTIIDGQTLNLDSKAFISSLERRHIDYLLMTMSKVWEAFSYGGLAFIEQSALAKLYDEVQKKHLALSIIVRFRSVGLQTPNPCQ